MMKITFRRSGFGGNYWYIESNQGSVVLTSDEVKELVKQMKEAGFQ